MTWHSKWNDSFCEGIEDGMRLRGGSTLPLKTISVKGSNYPRKRKILLEIPNFVKQKTKKSNEKCVISPGATCHAEFLGCHPRHAEWIKIFQWWPFKPNEVVIFPTGNGSPSPETPSKNSQSKAFTSSLFDLRPIREPFDDGDNSSRSKKTRTIHPLLSFFFFLTA